VTLDISGRGMNFKDIVVTSRNITSSSNFSSSSDRFNSSADKIGLIFKLDVPNKYLQSSRSVPFLNCMRNKAPLANVNKVCEQ